MPCLDPVALLVPGDRVKRSSMMKRRTPSTMVTPNLISFAFNYLTIFFRPPIGLTDLMLSSSSSSASETDEEGRTGVPRSSQRLSSAMVDRATLIKLTKEDLLLLWQAAEMEWVRKLGKTKNQRDALLLRLRRSKNRTVAPSRAVSAMHRHTHPPSTAPSSSVQKYGNSD